MEKLEKAANEAAQKEKAPTPPKEVKEESIDEEEAPPPKVVEKATKAVGNGTPAKKIKREDGDESFEEEAPPPKRTPAKALFDRESEEDCYDEQEAPPPKVVEKLTPAAGNGTPAKKIKCEDDDVLQLVITEESFEEEAPPPKRTPAKALFDRESEEDRYDEKQVRPKKVKEESIDEEEAPPPKVVEKATKAVGNGTPAKKIKREDDDEESFEEEAPPPKRTPAKALFDRESEEISEMSDPGEVTDPSWEPEPRTAEETDNEQQSESEAVAGPARVAQTPRGRGSGSRGRGRGRGRGKATGRSRGATTTAATTTAATGQRWYDDRDPDITPTQPVFRPLRNPGSQLITTSDYSVLDFFHLFFTKTMLQTIVNNTNEYGRAHYSKPSEPWTDITLLDMFSFLSIVVYMGFVKAPSLTDYWRTGSLYSFDFTKKTITGKRFFTISRALHLSSAAEDDANERKKGTYEFDRLGKTKPLYTQIREACKANYHPDQHLSVDERMVASKARIRIKQYIKNKPTRWGFKLFVLAESKTGYTWDFFIYEGKSTGGSGKGLGYETVMELVNPSVLGTGYKLYVDNFYTSPTLFRDLYEQRIWACGTLRANTVGCPKPAINALDSKSSRGSIRWLREDPLLFVQWRDTKDITLCSTIHTAHGTQTAKRKMRDGEGNWTSKDIPIPPAVQDYNQHMGGVDLSDQLIGYYDVIHKTKKWYKTLFYHFVDIAVVNAFILYKAQCTAKGRVPMQQKAFRETLAVELSREGFQQRTPQKARKQCTPQKAPTQCTPQTAQGRAQEHPEPHHRLVFIAAGAGDKTSGRLKCRKCHAKTAVKCATCNMPLCFVVKRDCYNDWHREKNM